MSWLNYHHLFYFWTVAREGSIAKACDRLLLTQPTISGQIRDNPAIEYLKMKSFIVSRPLNDTDLTDKNLVKEIAKTFEAMKPMIDFLNHAMQ